MSLFNGSRDVDQIQQLADYIDHAAALNIQEESDRVFQKLKERRDGNG